MGLMRSLLSFTIIIACSLVAGSCDDAGSSSKCDNAIVPTALTLSVEGPAISQAAYSDEYFTVEVSTAGCYTVSEFPGGCTCSITGYTGNCLDDYAEFPPSDGDFSFNLTAGTHLIKISNPNDSTHLYDILVDTDDPSACAGYI